MVGHKSIKIADFWVQFSGNFNAAFDAILVELEHTRHFLPRGVGKDSVAFQRLLGILGKLKNKLKVCLYFKIVAMNCGSLDSQIHILKPNLH